VKAIIINTASGKSFNHAFTSYLLKVILALLLLLWCAGIFYSFLASNSINHVVSTFLKHSYSIVCHQAEYKLIYLDDSSTYLCARCTGIYAGALFMAVSLLMVNLRTNISLKPLIIASAILLLDVIFVNTGLYKYTSWIAFTSGFLFGATIFIYIIEVLGSYFNQLLEKRFDE
jgi:uncharacterized membrane protein